MEGYFVKVAVYPGSFNPWHQGHQEVLDKALRVFDKVVVAQGCNPTKEWPKGFVLTNSACEIVQFQGLFKDFCHGKDYCAIIKGLRNAQDLEYETCQQYWNEDLGLGLPVFYIICSRENRHISSSAIRAIEKVKK